VIQKTALLLLMCFRVHAVLSAPAAAQIPPSCLVRDTWWTTDGPIPIGYFYYSDYPGTFAYVIAAMECPPPCPGCQASAGHPIALATGDTYINEPDIQIPGLARIIRER
jgi:hypothetical protein